MFCFVFTVESALSLNHFIKCYFYCRGVKEVSQKPGGVFGAGKKESTEIEVSGERVA